MKCFNEECQQDCETGFDCVHDGECDFFISESEKRALSPVDSQSSGSDEVTFEQFKAMLKEAYSNWHSTDDFPFMVELPMTREQEKVWNLVMNPNDLNEPRGK